MVVDVPQEAALPLAQNGREQAVGLKSASIEFLA
jgi:hypothetical protein